MISVHERLKQFRLLTPTLSSFEEERENYLDALIDFAC